MTISLFGSVQSQNCFNHFSTISTPYTFLCIKSPSRYSNPASASIPLVDSCSIFRTFFNLPWRLGSAVGGLVELRPDEVGGEVALALHEDGPSALTLVTVLHQRLGRVLGHLQVERHAIRAENDTLLD